MKYYESILETVGNTPIVHLKKIEKIFSLPYSLFAKVERFNPTGSIKDRTALSIMDEAAKEGRINEDTLIVEATSGNTGIALAMICASRSLKLHIYMPENSSKERVLMMRAYGAKVILTPKSEGMKGAEYRAKQEIGSVPNSFCPSQFANPANPLAHLKTAREIDEDMEGNVSAIVGGLGTGGTMMGIARYYKGKDVSLVGVEPASSPLLTIGQAGPHKIQGIGPNFVPEIMHKDELNEIIDITDEEAYEGARILAKEEGIFVGISSGAALMGAIKLEEKHHKNGNVIVILPDEGERYLSVEGLYD